MKRIEGGMSEAAKMLITRSSSAVRENRKSHKDRATFDTTATIQVQAQRLDSLKNELKQIEQQIKNFEALLLGV